MKTLLLLSILSFFNQKNTLINNEDSLELIVNITNIDSEKGSIVVGLYNSSGTWLGKVYMGKSSQISHKTATVTFEGLSEGEYAISLYHDENDNGKLDTGIFGIPKEDYACSRGARGRFGPPKWNDAVFHLDNSKEIIIKL